jgi:hypothetical protein
VTRARQPRPAPPCPVCGAPEDGHDLGCPRFPAQYETRLRRWRALHGANPEPAAMRARAAYWLAVAAHRRRHGPAPRLHAVAMYHAAAAIAAELRPLP